MKHVMIDCYGAVNFKLDDMTTIYNLLNGIADIADLTPVAPPTLIPYYYCEDKEDVGISAYLFLKGGHITIHTFSKRECYFVDVVYDGFYNAEKIYEFLNNQLPFDYSLSQYQITDRRVDEQREENVTVEDFGPHLVARINPKYQITLDSMFDALENLVYAANMTPICRASVIKDNLNKPQYYQGIIIIAQSHISLYYDLNSNTLYFDLFSCAYFNFDNIKNIISEMFGELQSMQLVKRGDKYTMTRSSDIDLSVSIRSGRWQRQCK